MSITTTLPNLVDYVGNSHPDRVPVFIDHLFEKIDFHIGQ